MPDLVLFVIGAAVTGLVVTAILMISVQEAKERIAEGRVVRDPIDRLLVDVPKDAQPDSARR